MLTRKFGKYRLATRLGRGGMADVYLARDTELGRDVALKLLEIRPDRDSQEVFDAERRGAVLQEAFAAVDAHVPAVHAYGTLAGHFYLDMEYVEGEDLAERLARGGLPPAEAVRIALDICDFLERAHAFETTVDGLRVRGIIHGDLKPKNVRLGAADEVKILDFGIAKGLSLTRKLTRNDFGSLAYLSPERLDTGAVDVHSDCWAVGVLLYELLSGELPFRGETNGQLERQILARVAPAPLPVQCPAALVRIALKLLHRDRARRYESAAAIGTDLRKWRDGSETMADCEWDAGLLGLRSAGPNGHDGPAGDTADSEATRRTRSAEEPPAEEEPTRRVRVEEVPAGDGLDDLPLTAESDAPAGDVLTNQPGTALEPIAAPADAATPGAPGGPAPGRPQRQGRVAVRLVTAATLAALAVVGNELRVWGDARDLRVEVATRPPAETPALWNRYESLSRQSLLGFGVLGVRGPLRDRFLTQAERVYGNYRHNAPLVREAQWIEAVSWLTSALALDPSNRGVTARLRYCEGHLHRIDAEARRRRKQPATDALNEAVARFEEAARLDRGWPDPYLGLARVYIYGLEDLDKAIAALDEAEKRGYRGGSRELAQLADGYRARAERQVKDADALEGLPQQRESLDRAASDLRQAIELYQKAAGFGDAGSSLRVARKRLDEVEARIERIDEPNLLERILREVVKRDPGRP